MYLGGAVGVDGCVQIDPLVSTDRGQEPRYAFSGPSSAARVVGGVGRIGKVDYALSGVGHLQQSLQPLGQKIGLPFGVGHGRGQLVGEVEPVQ